MPERAAEGRELFFGRVDVLEYTFPVGHAGFGESAGKISGTDIIEWLLVGKTAIYVWGIDRLEEEILVVGLWGRPVVYKGVLAQ